MERPHLTRYVSAHFTFFTFIFPSLLIILLFFLFIFWFTFPTLETYLLEGKKQVVKEQVRSAVNLLSIYENREKKGELSRTDAQFQAREILREIRFGDMNQDYFFICDTALRSVMHPLRKDLEGQDMSHVKDANGKKYIVELIEMAKRQGDGFIIYNWYLPDNKNVTAPKLSHVRFFKPWGWVVGTGIFIDDINHHIHEKKKEALTLILSFLLVIAILSWIIVKNGIKIEKKRLKAEKQLQKSEERYRTLFECSREAIFILSPPDFLYVSVNQAACDLFGAQRPEALLYLSPATLSPQWQPDGALSSEKLRSHADQCLEKGSLFFEWLHQKMAGTLFEASILLTRIDIQDQIVILGTIRDITAEKRAAALIRQSEENLRITLNSIGDAVIATDVTSAIVQINPVACELTGWSAEEAIGRNLGEVFRIVNGETRLPAEDPVKQILASGKIVGLANNTILISKSGREHLIADSGSPIRDDNGDITGAVLVWRDVTEKHRVEEQLRQSQKMDSIGQLAGGIAHDFNNILAGIVGAAELLSEELKDNAELTSLVKRILEAAERTTSLTNKLLAFSRKGKYQSIFIDLNQLIQDCMALLKRSIDRKINITMDLTPEPVGILGDPGQIESTIINLCVNARDAMPDGGDLIIQTALLDGREINGFTNHEKVAVLTVTDTGAGIEKEILPKIFEPFFTTKPVGKGTGLGLSAVYGTVREHLGEISVKSEVGAGTAFTLFFPAAQTPPPEVQQKGDRRALPMEALIVEDDDSLRFLFSEYLSKMGIKATAASNGEAALAIFRETPFRFQLIILDMIMPIMNGRETFQAMRELNNAIQVIFISGFDLDGSHAALLSEPGIIGFLQKPFTRKALENLISKVLL